MSSKVGTSYSANDFQKLFFTAYCGYQAVRKEFLPPKKVRIETGNWGAGAFGNDVRASALVQIAAAFLADVTLDVYPFSNKEKSLWDDAINLMYNSIVDLNSEGKAVTPKNLFERAQALATQLGDPIRARKGNGT